MLRYLDHQVVTTHKEGDVVELSRTACEKANITPLAPATWLIVAVETKVADMQSYLVRPGPWCAVPPAEPVSVQQADVAPVLALGDEVVRAGSTWLRDGDTSVSEQGQKVKSLDFGQKVCVRISAPAKAVGICGALGCNFKATKKTPQTDFGKFCCEGHKNGSDITSDCEKLAPAKGDQKAAAALPPILTWESAVVVHPGGPDRGNVWIDEKFKYLAWPKLLREEEHPETGAA